MGAVAAVVHGRRIDAGRDLARSVDERDVGDEVPGKARRELAGKVGMRGVDAGIEDADEDAAVTGVDRPGEIRLDHGETPEERVQGVHARRRSAVSRTTGLTFVNGLHLGIGHLHGVRARQFADRSLAAGAEDGLRGGDGLDEAFRRCHDREGADRGVACR